MKPYSDFRVGSEGFLRDLRTNTDEAHAELLGHCAASTDPKVRGAWERWRAFHEITTFHANSGKTRPEK